MTMQDSFHRTQTAQDARTYLIYLIILLFNELRYVDHTLVVAA